MRKLALSILLRFIVGSKNAWLFWKAYSFALDQTAKADDFTYYGNVKHNICYERVRTLLQREGDASETLKGAVIHFAVALAYLDHSK